MNKTIVGDWGAWLNDRDYGRALAALGVLETIGTQQHRASADPEEILAALQEEFKDGDRTALWRGAYNITGSTENSWRKTIHQDAQALADGWELVLARNHHPRKRPRLAVTAGWRRRPDLFDLDGLMSWLGANDTGCEAVVLAPEDVRPEQCRTVWHWPLHIGVPAGAEGRNLLEALKNRLSSWLGELGLLRLVGEVRDDCDVLILPPGMAGELVEQPKLRLRASFVVCLDEPVPWSTAAADTPQARLRAKLGAAGVGLAGASLDPAFLYYRLMEELSHDLPVHAALWRAIRNNFGSLPVILGEPESLDQLRILGVAEHLDRKQALLKQPSPPRQAQREERPTRGMGGGKEAKPPHTYEPPKTRSLEKTASELGGDLSFSVPEPPLSELPPEPVQPPKPLSDMVRERPFNSERNDGKPAADAIAAEKVALEENRRLRHIQAYGWREDTGLEPAWGLAPDRASLLTVHIGPDEKPRPDPPFPEGQIDFSAGPVGVTVQLELAGAAVAAVGKNEEIKALGLSFPNLSGGETTRLFHLLDSLVAVPEPANPGSPLVSLASEDIVLPVAGDSTRAIFAVWPQAGVKEVQGRIAIVHQNRIVQTACLQALVTLKGNEGPGIVVAAETAVHPRLDDLAERRQFDVALMAADDLGGHLRLTLSRDGQPEEIHLGNLKESLQKIRDILSRAAAKWDYSQPLQEQPALRPILYGLASNGCLLFESLREKLGADLVKANRLQLVCRGTAFFPLEYVYSGPPPQDGAHVCPIFLGKEGGSCQQFMPAGEASGAGAPMPTCPYIDSENHLCPFHFWGFTKVIERHSPPVSTAAGEETIRESRLFPVPSRHPFGNIQSILYAASSRAFAFCQTPEERNKEHQQLAESLGTLGVSSYWAPSWKEWQEKVKENPDLLVLIVHTDEKPDELGISTTPVLEIGEGETLPKHLINATVIGDPAKVQLLLLIGCSTAAVTEDFAPYHERFRLAGADVILATLSTIRGIDALPLVRQTVELLQQRLAGGQETAFGELLRELRRQLFTQGYPGVLGLVGFGDADWVLGG